MKKLKVLVADSQVIIRRQLIQEIGKDEQFQIIGATGNGKEAYEIFEKEEPDIVIFDLLLPIYDGYTLLDKMKEYGVSDEQKLIMTTPLTSDLLASEAFNHGVDYVLTKPYDVTVTVRKIKTLFGRMNRNTIPGETEMMISKKLNEIGIPVRLKGYRYLITALKRVLDNEDTLESVTKILYPDVAKKHNSTAQRVEKAIRHAIEVAWSINVDNPAQKEFKYLIGAGKTRPTNSEFIAKLAQDMKLSYNQSIVA